MEEAAAALDTLRALRGAATLRGQIPPRRGEPFAAPPAQGGRGGRRLEAKEEAEGSRGGRSEACAGRAALSRGAPRTGDAGRPPAAGRPLGPAAPAGESVSVAWVRRGLGSAAQRRAGLGGLVGSPRGGGAPQWIGGPAGRPGGEAASPSRGDGGQARLVCRSLAARAGAQRGWKAKPPRPRAAQL